MKITRKEFLGQLIKGAAGIAGAALVVGCGSSDSSADARPTSCAMNGTAVTIGTNHNHVLRVSKEDVVAGTAKSYDITGTATHAHTVNVTAAMFTTLLGNMSVQTTTVSDATGHGHMITIMCA